MSRWTFYTAPALAPWPPTSPCTKPAPSSIWSNWTSPPGQQEPGLPAREPQGRVPALATPQGVLTGTPALLAFVAQSFPAAGLAPLDDPFAFARMQELASYLASTATSPTPTSAAARW